MTAETERASDCPFCHPDPTRLLLEAGTVMALWDAFSVSPGHALIVTRRHVPTWFEATPAEQHALVEAIAEVKAVIDQRHAPAGYNVGFNAGEAAGQTIFHLHIHVIPRYPGDVPEPRGGIRGVIPGRASY